jgi:hypothetical protein
MAVKHPMASRDKFRATAKKKDEVPKAIQARKADMVEKNGKELIVPPGPVNAETLTTEPQKTKSCPGKISGQNQQSIRGLILNLLPITDHWPLPTSLGPWCLSG